MLSGGTGITYNSSTGAISYSGTVYTDSSVRALISLTTTGTSGASTYNNTTGVINVPEYTLAGLGGITASFLSGGTGITYNSSTGAISYSGTVYTDASVRALFSASGSVSYNNTTGVISLTGGNLTEATSSVLTITGGSGAVIGGGTSIQVKQATTSISGFLSSTDWTTFNNKQATITLTTTGTSGNATFSSNTLNIPNYGSALSGYLPLTGGTLTGALSGTTATFSGLVTLNSNEPLILNRTNNTSTSNAIRFQTGGTTQWYVGSDSYLQSGTENFGFFNGAYRLVITPTGAATFSSSVNAQLLSISNGYYLVGRNAANTAFRTLLTFDSANKILIGQDSDITAITLGVGSEAMRITSAGNVGIGTSSPSGKLQIVGDGGALHQLRLTHNGTGGNGSIDLGVTSTEATMVANYSSTAIPLVFYTGATERMRITSGGNTLMGTTSDNGERLYVSGSIRATGSITANSDISLKKNLLKIENALEKVEQINGYTYELKADDSKRHAGVIAQEIDKVFPEIVNTGNDGLMGVEYGNISALLIEAIKEQQTQIKELKALLNK